MSIKQALLIELEREKENTLRMLKVLKNDAFGWKPHEKSMSLGELANHVVELHGWMSFVIEKDSFNFHTDYIPSALSTADDLIKALENHHEKNKSAIDSMDDTEVFKNWALKAGDHVIAEMPKTGAIRFIVNNHLIHHRGQMTVYLRMLDIPVPGIYGPSADDKRTM